MSKKSGLSLDSRVLDKQYQVGGRWWKVPAVREAFRHLDESITITDWGGISVTVSQDSPDWKTLIELLSARAKVLQHVARQKQDEYWYWQHDTYGKDKDHK